MKYFIVGNGDFAIMLQRYLKNTRDICIEGFTVQKEIINAETINGLPVISTEEMVNIHHPDDCKLILGIGYRNMSRIKESEYHRYTKLGYDFINYIHPSAIIEKDVVLGRGNNIFEGVIIQSGVKMGDANHIYGGAMVAHDTEMGNFNFVSVKSCIAGCTKIGNNCFFGANSTVRDHLAIADYTLVGAGTYLSRDSEPYQVIVEPKSYVLEGKSSLEFI